MKTLKKRMVLILLITLLIIPNLKASEIVGTTVEITEDAINLFINEQYNRAGFQSNITGNVSGVTYNITLHLPNVRLLDNQAKVVFGFEIESNVFNGFIEFEDGFSFSIPSINELSVKGVSQAFKDKVNSLDINPILKSVIISSWESLQLEVYPMNLAKKVENSDWLVERAISIVDPYFSISFDVDPGKLKIGLNTYLEGREYLVAGLFYETNKWWLKIGTGCQVEVKEIYLYNIAGQEIVHGTNLGTCPKNGGLSISINSSLSYQYYITKILYKTSDTFYLRGYKSWPGGYVAPNNILN
jgi:hypothetical protein